MAIVPRSQTVDIGHGRGRATPRAAASIRRVDAALGRPWDVNSAWRDPVIQQTLRDAYEHYQRYGRPWAPIALRPNDSVHCAGEAIDSDDQSAAAVALLEEHGWRRTVYRNVNGRWTLVEPWHYEYFIGRDRHLGETAGGTATKPTPKPAPIPVPEAEPTLEDLMAFRSFAIGYRPTDGVDAIESVALDWDDGAKLELHNTKESYSNSFSEGLTEGGLKILTKGHYDYVLAKFDEHQKTMRARELELARAAAS